MMGSECTLRVKVHNDIPHNIVVVKGFKPCGDVLAPEENGVFLAEEGIYCIFFEADGYCSQQHLIQIETEREMTVDIYPMKLTGKNAEFKGPLFILPEAFEKALYSDEIGKRAEAYAFDTPGFGKDKGELCFTTSEEFSSYITDKTRECELIKIKRIENIDVVLISKDKACDVKDNGKLKVLYQAQVHGTEPASGEGALAFIAEAIAGETDKLLDVMDIWVIPCCNPIGTDRFERDCRGININRDGLELQCRETEILHSIFLSIMPEVVIDAHTFTRANGISSEHLDRSVLDIRISPAQSKNIDRNINKLSAAMAAKAIKKLRKEGIRSGYYGDSADPSTSRVFYGLFNTCSFLLESEGTRSGKIHFRRNVWCQLNAVKTLLNIVEKNADSIRKTVAEARRKLIERDEKDCKSAIYVLEHGKSEKSFFKTFQPSYDLNGNIADNDNVILFPKRSITIKKTAIPQEYTISKSADDAEILVELLRKNGAEVIEDEGAYTVPVRQIAMNMICALLNTNRWREKCDLKNLQKK